MYVCKAFIFNFVITSFDCYFVSRGSVVKNLLPIGRGNVDNYGSNKRNCRSENHLCKTLQLQTTRKANEKLEPTLKGVDLNITEKEIKEVLQEKHMEIKILGRSKLIRSISHSRDAIDEILKNELNICNKFEHSAEECPAKQLKCAKCAGKQKIPERKAKDLRCSNCGQEQPAWSRKCEADHK